MQAAARGGGQRAGAAGLQPLGPRAGPGGRVLVGAGPLRHGRAARAGRPLAQDACFFCRGVSGASAAAHVRGDAAQRAVAPGHRGGAPKKRGGREGILPQD